VAYPACVALRSRISKAVLPSLFLIEYEIGRSKAKKKSRIYSWSKLQAIIKGVFPLESCTLRATSEREANKRVIEKFPRMQAK